MDIPEPIVTWIPTGLAKGMILIIQEITDDEMESLIENGLLIDALNISRDEIQRNLRLVFGEG